MKDKWNVRGVLIPVITPFNKIGEIDEAALREIVDFMLSEQKADAIMPCGTTGESPTLGHEEHMRVIEVVLEQVNGRVPVIAGTGSNSTDEAVKMTKAAVAMGVSGTLQVCPYYNRPSQEGIFAHFAKIAESADAPMILYNIPFRTGREIATETSLRLAEIENIVGIKEASGTITTSMDIIEKVNEKRLDFKLYSGEDAMTYSLLALGGDGCVAAIAHVFGAELSEMCSAAWSGDFKRAREIHYDILPAIRALFCEPNPAAIKQALIWMGLPAGTCRLPLLDLSEKGKAILKKALVDLGKVKESNCV